MLGERLRERNFSSLEGSRGRGRRKDIGDCCASGTPAALPGDVCVWGEGVGHHPNYRPSSLPQETSKHR